MIIPQDKQLVETKTEFPIDKINTLAMLSDNIKNADVLAEVVKDSSLAEAFKDSDGKVNKADIIGALILGSDIGLNPITSLKLGKTLNVNKYLLLKEVNN